MHKLKITAGDLEITNLDQLVIEQVISGSSSIVNRQLHSSYAHQQQFVRNIEKINKDQSTVKRSEMSLSLGPLKFHMKQEEINNDIHSSEKLTETYSSKSMQEISEMHQEYHKSMELKASLSEPGKKVFNAYSKPEIPTKLIDIKV